MKATELMIGDLVISTMNKAVYQIDPIFAYGIIDAMLKNDPDIDNHFEPIPLTPEILEKNGWHKITYLNKDWYGHYDTPFYVKIVSRDTYFYVEMHNDDGYCVLDCMYVHELQHALRLCELNNLAENFKV